MTSSRPIRAVFLERDGVINYKSTLSRYVLSPEDFHWIPGSAEAIAQLGKSGYKVIVVTTQEGLASGQLTEADLQKIHDRLQMDLFRLGGRIDAFYVCSHSLESGCDCRKPKSGLFLRAKADFNLDFSSTAFIGCDERDLVAGRAVGCPTFIVTEQNPLREIVQKEIVRKGKSFSLKLADQIERASLYWRVVISPYRWKMMAMLAITLVGALFDILTVGVMVPLADVVSNPSGSSSNLLSQWVMLAMSNLGLGVNSGRVIFLLLLLACFLFFMRSGILMLQQYFLGRMGHGLYRITKSQLFENSLRTHYEIFSKKSRGVAISDITQPAESIWGAFMQLGTISTGVVNCVAMIAVMAYLSWWATLIIAAMGVLSMLIWKQYLPKLTAACGFDLYEAKRHQSHLEVDALDGIRVVKSNALESTMVAKHRVFLENEKKPMIQMIFFRNSPMVGNEALAFILIAVLGVFTFIWPAPNMTFATLVGIFFSLRKANPALSSISSASVDLNKWRRGLEILEQLKKRTILERRGGQEAPPRIEEIRFEDVSFYYDTKPDTMVLKGVNLSFKVNSITALVGPSGSGKSTIANLLIGLYEPRSGAIKINDINFQNLLLTSWRNHIGYVSQDVFLFNTTLKENIALWKPDVKEEDIINAAKLAQLHDFVLTLPEGYDTMVGDRGLRLSGGQNQRVALARAILRKPQVLIFDEATSALDNLTEKAVYKAIDILRKDAIILVIAHRLSTIKDVDNIVFIEKGVVVEQGTHDSLMSAKSSYARLYLGDDEESMVTPKESAL
ncbi:MAG: Vitamin B12 import ATP-binding protein BtuD [Elusimicrobia bacterium]|nr:Vitamin B12 import ATP-binding protein BtuD [Elusimicrobiota bacterium]